MALPLLFVAGNLFLPLCYVVVLGLMAFWAYKEQHSHLILLLLLILVFGDSRLASLQFIKNLRVLSIIFLAVLSIQGLALRRYRLTPAFLLAVPFFVSASISGLASPNPVLSYAKMISYFLMLLVVFHYLQAHLQRQQEQLLMDILFMAAWIYTLGLVFLLINPGMVYIGDRFRGMLGNPNGLGIYSSLMFAYTFILWHLYPHRRRPMAYMFGVLFISVILSESRNALGGIGLFLLLYKLYRGKPVRRRLFWFVLLPMGILFLRVVGLETLVGAIGLDEYLRVDSITTGTGRFLAWGIGWSYILQSPLFGGGFAFEELTFFQLRDFFVTTEHQGGMHNSYLTLIMNTGFVGFALFLGFLIVVLSRVKPAYLGLPFLITSLLSANFESWLAASLNAFTIHFFLIVMLLSNYRYLTRSTSLR